VFRYVLQLASKMKYKDFSRVEFAYKGESKFYITGYYFKQLGQEYEIQNTIYTTRTFPENVKNMDGTAAFGQWTGGMLGVLKEQMDDMSEFHDKWYLDDLINK